MIVVYHEREERTIRTKTRHQANLIIKKRKDGLFDIVKNRWGSCKESMDFKSFIRFFVYQGIKQIYHSFKSE